MSDIDEFLTRTMKNASVEHVAGRLDRAERFYREALSRSPGHASALHGLGVIAYQTGHTMDAIRLLKQSLAVRPDSADTLNALGLAHRALGESPEAINAHRLATQLKPLDAGGFSNLSLALRDTGQFGEAERVARIALNLAPRDPLIINNLGTVLMHVGRFAEAQTLLRESLRISPDYIKTMNNLGTSYLWAAQPREAIIEYERALQLMPQYADLHWHLAIALLTIGEWIRGWAEYEWRWECREYRAQRYRFRQMVWDGSNLAGKIILVTHEQGLGDTIQFARYLPLLTRRGARVWLLSQRELVQLFRKLDGVERVIDAQAAALPQSSDAGRTAQPSATVSAALQESGFDVHIPLLSLPGRFGTKPEMVPHEVPYIQSDGAKREAWRVRLADDLNGSARARFRVGLVWAGRPVPDPLRTCGLAPLAPLSTIAGMRLISLQVGPAAEEANRAPNGMAIENYSADLNDFSDTAALIANLDLVITIDSAVAHLAGALGCRTWTLLRECADWRWLVGRDDSPWYPTMRLFRQTRRGDWEEVVARVAAELGRLVSREG